MPIVSLADADFSDFGSAAGDDILAQEARRRLGDANDEDDNDFSEDDNEPAPGQAQNARKRQRHQQERQIDVEDRDEVPYSDERVGIKVVIDFRFQNGLSNDAVEKVLEAMDVVEGRIIIAIYQLAYTIKAAETVARSAKEQQQAAIESRRRQDRIEDKLDRILTKIETLEEEVKELKAVNMQADEIDKMMDTTANIFYSPEIISYSDNNNIFAAVQRFVKRDPLKIGRACKVLIEGDNDKAKQKQIWSPIKKKISTLKCHLRDYITESIKKKWDLLKLLKKATGSYGVRLTKDRIIRFALLRYYTAKIGARDENNKTNPKLWTDIDGSLRDLWERQKTEPAKVKREINKVLDSDKRAYGKFVESNLEDDNGNDAAYRRAIDNLNDDA
ncbi:hypothetical protein OC834_007256 [Tilletia horrida]|nr:hypothetical protein OC834_007256 [Tilletia horrida]